MGTLNLYLKGSEAGSGTISGYVYRTVNSYWSSDKLLCCKNSNKYDYTILMKFGDLITKVGTHNITNASLHMFTRPAGSEDSYKASVNISVKRNTENITSGQTTLPETSSVGSSYVPVTMGGEFVWDITDIVKYQVAYNQNYGLTLAQKEDDTSGSKLKNFYNTSSGDYMVYLEITYTDTYTITYSATGADAGTVPANSTKQYNESVQISSTIPTKTGTRYSFLCWKSAGGNSYSPGSIYSANANLALTAQWYDKYAAPTITNFSCYRCNSSGTQDISGTYGKVAFDWSVDSTLGLAASEACAVKYRVDGASSWNTSVISLTGTSGTGVSHIFGSGLLTNTDVYEVMLVLTDSLAGTVSVTTALPASAYPIDFKSNGKGVAFGGKSDTDNTLDIYWSTKIRSGLNVTAGGFFGGDLEVTGNVTAANIPKMQYRNTDYAKSTNQTITFDTAFSSGCTPIVIACWARSDGNESGNYGALKISSITNSSFVISAGGSTPSDNKPINWIAFGY